MAERHWLSDMGLADTDAERIITTLNEHLRPGEVSEKHPLYDIWRQPSKRHCFELAHLASDCSVVTATPGADGLFGMMRRDAEGFWDFRYELRLAGAVGRAAGQSLIALGGSRRGPDIEVTSSSGHRVGIACYRASSKTQVAQQYRKISRELARRSLRVFHFSPLEASFCIQVTFQDAMPTESHRRSAKRILRRLLTSGSGEPEMRANGVVAQRMILPEHLLLPQDLRRVRLRIIFPIRAYERRRVRRHLDEKLQKESVAWAARYDGKAILAVEESDGAPDGALSTDLRELLPAHPVFAGACLTQAAYQSEAAPDDARLERIRWIGNPDEANPTERMRLEFRTFHENIDTWAGGRPIVSFATDHAREDWDLFATRAGSGNMLVESLKTSTHLVRLPKIPDGVPPKEYAALDDDLLKAVTELQKRATAFRRAPLFLTPYTSRPR